MKPTALITGASSGIGQELARVFVKNGYDLVLVARSSEKLHALAAELKDAKVTIITKDLAARSAAQEIFAETQKKNLRIDVLVNNAGVGDYGFFHKSDWSKQEGMINLNITALTHLTHLYLPEMVKNKNGRILNVASTAAFQPGPTMAVYYATKAFVLHFSEAIANELEGTGVTITALCPGATISGFSDAANLGSSRLFKGRKLPSSKEVAEYGYRAMTCGQKVAIHGALNFAMAQSIRLTPRSLVLKLVRTIQNPV